MAFATGRAGDAYVCHPFLVHTATWPHRGDLVVVKLEIDGGFALDGSDNSPFARWIVTGRIALVDPHALDRLLSL